MSANEAVDVKAIRDRLGLDRNELAELLGVSRQSVADWESGKRPTTTARAKTRERLEELKDARPEDLPPPRIFDEPEPEDAPPASVAAAKAKEPESLPVLSLERRVALMYEYLAGGITLFTNTREAQQSAALIKKNAPLVARAWVQWGAENPRVQRLLETMTGPGAAGQVIVVHGMIVMQIWAIYSAPAVASVAPPPPQPSGDGRSAEAESNVPPVPPVQPPT